MYNEIENIEENDEFDEYGAINVTNTVEANDAIRELKAIDETFDRHDDSCELEISRIKQQQADAKIERDKRKKRYMDGLMVYARRNVGIETKTLKTLKFEAGDIVFKKPMPKMVHDEAALLKRLNGTDYVSFTPKLAWGEYKKTLAIVGDDVVSKETGEVVDGVDVVVFPETLEVK
jgi:Bacteriophage Mu Gam like protein.